MANTVFYGSDSSCVSDVGLFDLQITNPQILIGQRIARRLQTPRGALAAINGDPNFGWDVRQYINGKFKPSDLSTAQVQIENECLKDEQVQTVKATVNVTAGNITINLVGASSAGPFSFTMNVQQLTASLIFNS